MPPPTRVHNRSGLTGMVTIFLEGSAVVGLPAECARSRRARDRSNLEFARPIGIVCNRTILVGIDCRETGDVAVGRALLDEDHDATLGLLVAAKASTMAFFWL